MKETNRALHQPLRDRTEGKFSSEFMGFLKMAVTSRQPVLLKGDSGTGKSTIVRAVARAKGAEVVRVDGSGNLTEDEIIGCNTLVATPDGQGMTMSWRDGVLTDAVRNGKWIIVEEINGIKPGVRLALHSVLEDNGFLTIPQTGERIYKHPDFRFFATMNPPSIQYSGTQKDNFAFSDRFITLLVPYLDVETERELLESYFGYNSSYPHYDKISESLNLLCEFAAGQRHAFSNGDGIDIPVTTRKLIQIVHHAHMFPILDVLTNFFRGLTDPSSAKALTDSLSQLITRGSELDKIFSTHGKNIPVKGFEGALAAMKSGAYETATISGNTPSDSIVQMGDNIDYFKLACKYSYQEVYDDRAVSEFDALCIKDARDFMKSRGYFDKE